MESSGRIAVLVHLALATATASVYALVLPPRPARLAAYRGPIGALGGWAYWVTRPVLRAARVLHLTPDVLTGIGLGLNVAAGVLVGLGAFGWAWVSLLWGSAADLLDGELARCTGTSSRAGAFLDSSLDRMSEIALLAGLGFVLHPQRVGVACVIAALGASFMVSYAKARGEGLGVACPTFGLERPHRLLVFIVAMLLATFLPRAAGEELLTYTCALVALSAGLTALGRMVIIHQLLRREGEPSRDWHGTPPGTMP
ncbi:MAG TPA: CDP-alcohol phosphatidyltransferase family protein [Anaeromyxobacter sp.]|nr:CDP-alcohol phosphatidyltransferase family protein [Anaeromyxobacter sp.]